MEKEIKNLDEIIKIQCMNGNYNYDPYMHGMANGLICARSVITGEEPKYIETPEVWLCDRPSDRDKTDSYPNNPPTVSDEQKQTAEVTG